MNIHLLPASFHYPMEPIPKAQPFDSDDFVFEVKWDGVRLLSVVDSGKIYLVSKRLHEKTSLYPELLSLPSLINARQAVLDGEAVVLRDGKPSFSSILRREAAGHKEKVNQMMADWPVFYMVFDLLHLDGNDLLTVPYTKRREALQAVLLPDDRVHLVDCFPSGCSLFEVVKNLCMEGIVAKRRGSFYVQGKKHNSWFKIKCKRQQWCLVGGYTMGRGKVNALLLGAFSGEDILFVGKAGSGLTAEIQDELTRVLASKRSQYSPFANLKSDNEGCYFVEPSFAVLVEFTEWTDDLRLRHPVIKGFSSIDPAQCRI